MAGLFWDKRRQDLRRRSAILGLVAAITLASAAALPFRTFDGRIDVMLPDRSDLREVFGLLRDIQVADKVLVTLAMRDGSAAPEALTAAAETYVAGLDPAWAAPLAPGFAAADVADDFAKLARRLPDYLSTADLRALRDGASSAAGVRAALQALKSRLQRPEGMWSAVAPGSDPLDWNGRLAASLLHAVFSFGYRAVPVGGHLMDPERRHLLLVLQTPVPMTDVAGGRGLLAHLAARAAELPTPVEARLVCGHLHTAGNEAIIRRDIRRTALAVSAVFLALFWGAYRDPRALGILLIPMLASVPALAAAAALFPSFSFIVLGFGSVIAGIAVDYGIHTYVAARSANPERNLAGIRRPVALSALTTLCVFVAFCFSCIPAYRQLGAFASFAIAISLVYAFWALPPFVRRRESAVPESPPIAPAAGSRAHAAGIAIGAVLALAVGIGLLARLALDPDVSKLDGTPQAVLDEETRAMAVWGGGPSRAAILVVEAPDENEALRLNDRLYAGLQDAGLPAAEISSLAPLWPSAETRRARRAAWNETWTDARIAELRRTVVQEAAALDYSEQAFAAFWEQFAEWRDVAAEPESAGFLEPLRRQFVHGRDGVVRATTFIPDEPAWIDAALRLRQEMPELRVISRRAFSADLSAQVVGEMRRTTIWAGIFILLVTGLALRRAGMLALAVLPAVAGMVWGGAGMALWGLSLNVSNLIAGILVFGLCIDYGICMAYAQRRGMRRDTFRAVTLSALTTALGAAVLLIADHPAFLSIGVTLVFGVGAGYLCAWLVLPAMLTLFPRLNPPDADAAKEGGA
ncbi:MAG TPA: hypothetical protein P5204_04935 [Kiritimatiellia bacterium]|nr:hypothetical protein [Kiritimatiellia bacterium]